MRWIHTVYAYVVVLHYGDVATWAANYLVRY
jgi:hypothetical protein